MLDFFSLRSDFDSGLLSLGFETLFSGPVIFCSDFSLVDFSDVDFGLSVLVDSVSFVDFLDGDFSESSETFFDFSARSDEAFSVDLVTGLDAFSVGLLDDFSDGFSDTLSEDLSDDFTGVDDIGLFDSSGFELFKIDFIVGFDGTTSTLSFSTVFDFTKLSGFFGETVLSDFLSAGFVAGSLFSDFGFPF